MKNNGNRHCRVVLTGGPGGGKTTAADLFRRELGEDVVIVPEAATLLYIGGFPRAPETEVRRASQRAIYHVQRNLEDAQAALYKKRILLCDRGSLDGAAYWPGDPEEFLADLGTSFSSEIARYDAVVFFETAAVGGMSIEGGNPVRRESLADAVALDRRLRDVWSRHPQFHFIKHEASFFQKISGALNIMSHIVSEHRANDVSR